MYIGCILQVDARSSFVRQLAMVRCMLRLFHLLARLLLCLSSREDLPQFGQSTTMFLARLRRRGDGWYRFHCCDTRAARVRCLAPWRDWCCRCLTGSSWNRHRRRRYLADLHPDQEDCNRDHKYRNSHAGDLHVRQNAIQNISPAQKSRRVA